MTPRDPEPVDETDDDDALSWAGDDDRGRMTPRLRDETDAAPAGADDAPLEEAPVVPRTPAERAFQLGTYAFGAVYLAISIGWIFSVQLMFYPGLDLLGEVMWQLGEFLAMVAAALWFAAVLTLTPEGVRRRGPKRMLSLLVGALVLVPWPALGYWIGSMQ
ncbi:hypothetical protein H4J02_10880 [Protaetiibacter sp. SSC-01]|uniref:hypothetical protein n=1 Tax=Protaetiibacter sp. SSC-01 TaxID=2759943 RepID=UPI0016574181|nr:hypothetical protein [Protaetiibacter sp. SSC-01]QNO36961.1 hypothetical protein H4J02_10880 [Protaetiibacter sp. SSC-01]